jgi:transcriptional regulator with XRE-family HTH domain
MKDLKSLFNLKNVTSGQVIKAFRTNFKISQNQLADAINITQTNLSSYENDHRNLGIEVAMKFAIFFQINVEDLLYPNGIEKDFKDYEKILKSSEKISKKLRLREA